MHWIRRQWKRCQAWFAAQATAQSPSQWVSTLCLKWMCCPLPFDLSCFAGANQSRIPQWRSSFRCCTWSVARCTVEQFPVKRQDPKPWCQERFVSVSNRIFDGPKYYASATQWCQIQPGSMSSAWPNLLSMILSPYRPENVARQINAIHCIPKDISQLVDILILLPWDGKCLGSTLIHLYFRQLFACPGRKPPTPFQVHHNKV